MTVPGDIAAVIPAYQAGVTIRDVVLRTLAQVDLVLVVDDGSLDATGRAARDAGAEVVRHPTNLGKGHALLSGFRVLFRRGFERVVTLDADGQHLPEQIPRLMEAMVDEPDLVLGTRSHLFAAMGSVRRLSNSLSSRAISFAAGQPLSDVQTGFRIYTRRLVECVPFEAGRFESESAVVVRAARAGYRIESIPIDLGFADGRSTSHYRPLVDSLRIASAVTSARFRASRVAVSVTGRGAENAFEGLEMGPIEPVSSEVGGSVNRERHEGATFR